ncbi:hypothetical protein LCGC14_1161780 [marine sediment metagenome]|uniref:Uncharacterized protein n=1 Tax=marine sediment metagenome TaxID=412755 RepID=A0A0F9PY11_9ZZZZ
MGPFYTTDLTIAVSEAGGLGVLSHATLLGRNSITDFKEQIDKVIEHTDKPFGFNIRVARMQTDHRILLRKIAQWRRENPKIREQMIYGLTSAGGPRIAAKVWQKSCPDMYHFHVAPALWLVDKVVESGCNGVVATGTEGGGHQSYEGVTTLVLLQEVRQKYPDLLTVACGGIADPNGVAAALAMGADAVAMGTRFIASTESEFHGNYKALIPKATDKDTMITTGGFGPIRLLKNKYCLEHGKTLSKGEKLAQEKNIPDIDSFFEDLHKYEIVYLEGDVENGAVPIGQSCGLINSINNVDDLISGFTKKAEDLLKKIGSNIS